MDTIQIQARSILRLDEDFYLLDKPTMELFSRI